MPSSDWVRFAIHELEIALLSGEDLILAVERYISNGSIDDRLYGMRKAVYDARSNNYRLYIDGVGWQSFPQLEQLDLYLRLRGQ